MRLLTRADLDGITSAVLLSIVEPIDEVLFVEPHKMQMGEIEVFPSDIIANLPYHPNCGMWFNHHVSNAPPPGTQFKGAFYIDPSAARTVHNFYRDPRFEHYTDLLEATDKVDSAQLTIADVRNPKDYVLLSLSLDPRSNLEASDHYYQCLLKWLKEESIDDVMTKPEVRQRCDRILNEQKHFEQVLQATSRAEGNVVVTNLLGVNPLPAGSRFLVYTLFPKCNASLKIYPARDDASKVCISLGYSIFNRTQTVNGGKFCADYGVGGHFGAGSFVAEPEQVDRVVAEVLEILKRNEAIVE